MGSNGMLAQAGRMGEGEDARQADGWVKTNKSLPDIVPGGGEGEIGGSKEMDGRAVQSNVRAKHGAEEVGI